MIGNLSFAAASHAFPATLRNPQQNADGEQTSSSALGGYRFIVLAMWAGLIIGGFCIWRHVPYAVIVTEYVEIGLFVASTRCGPVLQPRPMRTAMTLLQVQGVRQTRRRLVRRRHIDLGRHRSALCPLP